MANQRISDDGVLKITRDDVTDPSKVYIPLANAQPSTPGIKGKLDIDGLAGLVPIRVMTSSSHGLVDPDDLGKPLNADYAIYDDTSDTEIAAWILVNVIDADTLMVANFGTVTFDDALMEVGYDLATDGPFIYWDESAGTYVPTLPADSGLTARDVLYVTSVAGGNITAEIWK